MVRFKDIDKSELRCLYLDELMSTVELSERYGVCSSSILKWLQRIGVKRRSTGCPAVILRKFSRYSRADIQRMYWVEKMTQRGIGLKIGVSRSSVQSYFHLHGICARTLIEERRSRVKLKDLPDSAFVDLYHVKKLGLRELASRFGVNSETVRREMMFRGIKVRAVHSCKTIKSINENDLAYLAGVLAGDGSISDGYSFRLGATDKDFVDYVAALLGRIAPVSRYVEKRDVATWNKMYYVFLCRKKFVDIIKKLHFDNLNCVQKIRFINGFADSEGHVTDGKGTRPRLVISNNNRNLLLKISNFLNDEFNLDSKVFPLVNKGSCNCLSLGMQHGLVGFYSLHRFSIARKQKRFDYIIKSYGL